MKKYLPGPRVFEFPCNANFEDFVSTVKAVFFKDEDGCEQDFGIANSSGVPFEIDIIEWELDVFIKAHGCPPSKLRIYLLHYPVSD